MIVAAKTKNKWTDPLFKGTVALWIQTSCMVEHMLILKLKSPLTRCCSLQGQTGHKINGSHMLPNEGIEQDTVPLCLGGRSCSGVVHWDPIPTLFIVSHFCLISHFCLPAVKNMIYGTADRNWKERSLTKGGGGGEGVRWRGQRWEKWQKINREGRMKEMVWEKERVREEWQLTDKIPIFISNHYLLGTSVGPLVNKHKGAP